MQHHCGASQFPIAQGGGNVGDQALAACRDIGARRSQSCWTSLRGGPERVGGPLVRSGGAQFAHGAGFGVEPCFTHAAPDSLACLGAGSEPSTGGGFLIGRPELPMGGPKGWTSESGGGGPCGGAGGPCVGGAPLRALWWEFQRLMCMWASTCAWASIGVSHGGARTPLNGSAAVCWGPACWG